MRDVLVELLVVVLANLALGSGPQRGSLVHHFILISRHLFAVLPLGFLHDDGQRDVVGILADDGLQFPIIEEFILTFAQMQDDIGAACRLVGGRQRVIALAARFPLHRFNAAGAAGDQGHLVGNNERRIETDAELADQIGVLDLVAAEGIDEFFGTGSGDGADIVDDFLTAHADAVVGNGDDACSLVETDAYLQLTIVAVEAVVSQRLETQLVCRIGGIRNQFAQHDLLVAVERMNHQVQQLLHLGLKAQRLFFLCLCSHCVVSRIDTIECCAYADRLMVFQERQPRYNSFTLSHAEV